MPTNTPPTPETADSTLDLANLPNRFDCGEAQPRIYDAWRREGVFHSEPDPQRKPYTIVIPPPNVTGALHLGHALNNTLQDVLIRFKKMQGYNTLWMPGTDHAGIATQAVVEKRVLEEEGKSRHDLGREELVQRIWKWKDDYQTRIIGQLQQMGCGCDWERIRFTLDDTCARAVRRTFFDLFQEGRIYRGRRLVNWDTFLQTAVSDDEVFHEVVKGHFWHFRYPVIDPKPGEPEFVTIATTRPETMLGDTAIAVHPKPAAAFDALEKELTEKLAAASAKDRDAIQTQLDNIRKRRETMLPQLEQLRDMALDGRKVMLPLMEREIPLVADPWAKPELGSGCVKITPAHDTNDYEVGLRCNLPMINILLPDGTLNANAGKYEGQTVKVARKNVLADLESQGLLVETEDREIDLAHSDRSKTPIEPYLADQWFVKMDELAQTAMDAVTDGRVKIIPERYGKSYLDWLSEKRDWCISRNLWWGHRIPIWTTTDPAAIKKAGLSLPADSETTETNTAETSQKVVALRQQKNLDTGIVAYMACVAPGHDEVERQLEEAGFVQDSDVLDTWFSSALWPHSTLGWPQEEKQADLDYYYPTNVLITSRDIITLWVARMVLMGLHNVGEVPFGEVFIHPKILDGYGETMSKSKGNGVDPLDVIEKFGTDALRFGLTYITTQTQDVRMPVQFECPHCEAHIEQKKKNRTLPRIQCDKCGKEFSTQWARTPEDMTLPRGAVVAERFELARNFCNKLWNASRFVLMNLEGYTPATSPVPESELEVEDHWILSRLATVTQAVTENLETYKYAEASRVLYDFAWDEFCSFYIEMVKNRLQNESQRGIAQQVLAHTLDRLLRLLSPMIPFITEEVWQLLNRVAPQRGLDGPDAPDTQMGSESKRIVTAPWPEFDATRQNPRIEARFAKFQAALGALREMRARQNIPPREPIEFSIRCDQETVELLKPMEPYFASMAKATATGWGPEVEPPTTSTHVSLQGMDVFIDLGDFIDEEAERARLEKEQVNLEGMIAGKEKKLANQNFVDRAPEAVVQRERDTLTELTEKLAATKVALAKLVDND